MHPWDTSRLDQCSRCTFSSGLFYHDNIGKLGEIPDFYDEVDFEELVHFFFDHFASFFFHLPILL